MSGPEGPVDDVGDPSALPSKDPDADPYAEQDGIYGETTSAGTSRDEPAFEEMGPQVTFDQLLEYLAIDSGLRRSCKSLPITMALWITFVLLVLQHGQARGSYEAASFLSDAIIAAAVPTELPGTNTSSANFLPGAYFPGLTIGTIREKDHILPWLQGGLAPMIMPDGTSVNQMLEMQMLVGHVRVRQTRGRSTSTCTLANGYENFYSGKCHPSGGNPGVYGPKRASYQLEDYAFHNQGNERYEMWLEVGRPAHVINERVSELIAGKWVDLNTQDITVSALFLNMEAHIYCLAEMKFILHREGFIETDVKVKPVRGDVFTHWSHIFLDVVWSLLILLLLFEASQLAYDAYEREIFGLYLKDPYTWLDWFSVILGALLGWFFAGLIYQLDVFEIKVAGLGDAPRLSVVEALAFDKVQAQQDEFDYHAKVSALFYQLGNVAWAVEWHRLLAFWYSVVVVCRFLRGFTGQPRMAVLIQTLLFCSDFLLHYMIVFVMVMGNFTLGGYILFGGQVSGWSTYGSSLSRILLVLFNHFDFDELYDVAPVTSTVWYISFLIVVSMMLLNLLLASILNGYLEVRQRLGEPGAGFIKQIRDMMDQRSWSRTYEGSRKTAPNEEILKLLAADIDPHRVEKFGRMRMDRRLRTEDDLKEAEKSPVVTVDFLCKRGCSPEEADRLLERAIEWKHSLSVTSSPSHRLMLLVARQMSYVTKEVDLMSTRTKTKIENSMKGVDRLDLKHAKCVALAKRIQRAQELPPGWTAHVDDKGRRYLRQEETGLTSWTLPRHLV